MAVDMFLKLDGIKGESADRNHKGEIEVLSWSWGLSQQGSVGGGGGSAGKVSLQDFHFVHRVDKSSPKLMEAVCQGRHIKEAQLSLGTNQGKAKGDFLVLKMSDLLVSSVRPGARSGMDDEAIEAVSLSFVKLDISYRGRDGEEVKGSASSST